MVYGLFFSLSNRGVLGLLGRALIRPGERWKCSVHSLIPRGGSIEWAGLGEPPPPPSTSQPWLLQSPVGGGDPLLMLVEDVKLLFQLPKANSQGSKNI